MDYSFEIEKLKTRFETVFALIPKSEWRYYHHKSLRNFLFHLSKIKGHSEKEEVIQALNNYFTLVSEVSNEPIDLKSSLELFRTHLYPVAVRFEIRVGFAPAPPIKALIILLPVAGFLLYFIYQLNLYLFFIILTLFSLFILHISIKAINKKIYGGGF
jgi:hypothetical protein